MKAFRLSLCAVVILFAVPAMGQIDSFFDVFFVEINGSASNWNVLNQDPLKSGGSGWPTVRPGPDIGDWIQYPALVQQLDGWGQPSPNPSWWNEWFYDGNFRPERYKEVDIKFDYKLANPLVRGGANIVVNWSNELWQPGLPGYTPGAPPMTNEYIGRAPIEQLWMELGGPPVNQYSIQDYRLPVPYNPEWVSIDVTGYNISIIGGHLDHFCIPEPGSIILLATAGMGLLLFAWRRHHEGRR